MPNELTKPAPPADPLPTIVEWILEGQTQASIEEAIKTSWPSAKSRPLIVAAMKNIADAAEPDAALMKGWVIESLRLVHRRALEAGDFSAAIRALKELRTISAK